MWVDGRLLYIHIYTGVAACVIGCVFMHVKLGNKLLFCDTYDPAPRNRHRIMFQRASTIDCARAACPRDVHLKKSFGGTKCFFGGEFGTYTGFAWNKCIVINTIYTRSLV